MRASALLGYVPVGNMGLVLLATRIRDVLTLPGGHVVKLVVESKWFTVPLQARHNPDCCAWIASQTHGPAIWGPGRRAVYSPVLGTARHCERVRTAVPRATASRAHVRAASSTEPGTMHVHP